MTPRPWRAFGGALLATLAILSTSCTRRQVIPGVIAGTGAAMLTTGGIYRATLDTDEPFGSTDTEVTTTTVLLFGGIGVLLAGIIVSVTQASCETDADCWASDVCRTQSRTCVSHDAARALRERSAEGEEEEDGTTAQPRTSSEGS